ncbi:MAG: YdbH domain-containing protein [Bacteriovoracaceae bacterium]|nr:YdbH domain-containing protein [Bacteriovoracaceae bacterium]
MALGLLILVVVAIISRKNILEKTIKEIAFKNGIPHLSLNISRLGITKITISNIEVGRPKTLSIKKISLTLNPLEIITGRFGNLEIINPVIHLKHDRKQFLLPEDKSIDFSKKTEKNKTSSTTNIPAVFLKKISIENGKVLITHKNKKSQLDFNLNLIEKDDILAGNGKINLKKADSISSDDFKLKNPKFTIESTINLSRDKVLFRDIMIDIALPVLFKKNRIFAELKTKKNGVFGIDCHGRPMWDLSTILNLQVKEKSRSLLDLKDATIMLKTKTDDPWIGITSIGARDITFPKTKLNLEGLSIKSGCDFRKKTCNIIFNLENLFHDVPGHLKMFSRIDLNGETQLADKIISSSQKLDFGDIAILSKLKYNLEKKTGIFNIFETKLEFQKDKLSLKKLFPMTVNQIDDVTGRINFGGSIKLEREKIRPDIKISLSNLNIISKEKRLNGINTAININNINSPYFDNAIVTIEHVKTFTDITNLHIPVRIHENKIKIENMNGTIWNGNLNVTDFHFDLLKNAPSRLLVKIKEVSIEKMMNTFLKGNVKSTGKLYGNIPVEFDKKNIIIKNGALATNEHGIFQYIPDRVSRVNSQKNKQISLLLSYFEELHYKDFQILINNTPETGMELVWRMFGHGTKARWRIGKKNLKVKSPLKFKMTTRADIIKIKKSADITGSIGNAIEATLLGTNQAF